MKLCVGTNILEVNFLHVARELNIVDVSNIECVDSSFGFEKYHFGVSRQIVSL